MVMRTIPTEFYGDNTRWFMARVIDASPPAGLEGRIRIRIFGIHSDNVNDIPQADLPWAQVMNPSHSYGVSGFGVNTMIQANALVFGVFLDGTNSQLPLVLGSLPQLEDPTSVQALGREDITSNAFAYNFDQSDAQAQDPQFYGENDAANTARFFIDNGMTAKQASAVAGTLRSISDLDPTHAGGIAGYPEDTSRYSRFVTYGSRLDPQKDKDEIDVQLMFILQEFRTTHRVAMTKLISVSSIEEMIPLLGRHFVHPQTDFDETRAESLALGTYGSLGAR